MNVEAVLHMKEGLGENSYAQNSSHQKKNMDTVKDLVIDSATGVYASLMPERFTMADLGCSSGANALGMVENIIRGIAEVCRTSSTSQLPPEFSVLLNDLPTNDFNTIFCTFPDFISKIKADNPTVFLSGVPGSFYGRLFPTGSLHFVCSFNSLHWLSQVPPGLYDEANLPVNKGKMFISSSSPRAVPAAYLRQFQRDFGLFLKSRSAEMVEGGRMVMSMQSRETEVYTDKKTTLLWELLSESLASLVSQGLVEQAKVDTYNVPFYPPCIRDIEDEVRKEGSFRLDCARKYDCNTSTGGDAKEAARVVSMAVRAVQESMLNYHFGPDIMDMLFHKYAELITESMEKEDIKSVQLAVVLIKL